MALFYFLSTNLREASRRSVATHRTTSSRLHTGISHGDHGYQCEREDSDERFLRQCLGRIGNYHILLYSCAPPIERSLDHLRDRDASAFQLRLRFLFIPLGFLFSKQLVLIRRDEPPAQAALLVRLDAVVTADQTGRIAVPLPGGGIVAHSISGLSVDMN